jgi:hypothetical protein
MTAIYRLFLAGCLILGFDQAFSQSPLGVEKDSTRSSGSSYIWVYSKNSLSLNTRLTAVIPRLNAKNSRLHSPLLNQSSFKTRETELPTGSAMPFSTAVYDQWTKETGGALAQEFLIQKRDQSAYVFPMIQSAPRIRIKF